MRLFLIGVGAIATLVSLAGAYLMSRTVPPLFVGPEDDEPPGSETRPIVRLGRVRQPRMEDSTETNERLHQPADPA